MELLVLIALIALALVGAVKGLQAKYAALSEREGQAIESLTSMSERGSGSGDARPAPGPSEGEKRSEPPKKEDDDDKPFWQKVGEFALDLTPIGDIKTLMDPNASFFDKVLAGTSLVTSVIPGVGQAVKGVTVAVKVAKTADKVAGAVDKTKDVVKTGDNAKDAAKGADNAEEAGDLAGAGKKKKDGEEEPETRTDDPEGCKDGKCDRPSQCFAAGTLVYTAEGDRPIESIAVGDLVWSRDEHTGELALKRVTQTFVSLSYVLSLQLAGADYMEQLSVTPNHPFWVEGKGWARADALDSESSLWSPEGKLAGYAAASGASLTRVYNFEVEDTHTYFVGKLRAWVHNEDTNPADGCPEIDPARAERQTAAADALQPLQDRFPDARVGFRGSLARGTKGPHKGNAPFDPEDYDVDAFVVSDELASQIPANSKGFRNLARDPQYKGLVDGVGNEIKNLPGVRQGDTFKVRVFSEAEFAAKVGADEQYVLP